MNDVMKKRLIGVAVLVVIGVLVPLLLSKCMHGGSEDDGRSSMRVYNVNPNGAADTANATDKTSAVDGSTGAGQSDAADDSQTEKTNNSPRTPEAVSPQTAASEYSTPTVSGNDDSNSSNTSGSSSNSQRASSQSASSSSSASSQSSANSSTPTAQRNDSASGWLVQVAAFGDVGNAKALANELSGQYRASYAQADVNGKTWYRVNVGPFTSEGAARSTADSLRSQGRQPLVRHLP